MKKIFSYFYIETQWDNLGDALINRELIRLMGRHAHTTLGVAVVPENFKDMLGRDFLKDYTLDTKSTRTKFLWNVLRERMKGNSCYVFLSPGGWIGELDGRLNLRSWGHTALYHMLSWAGVRICQMGVSYEDIGPKLGWQLRVRSPAMYRHYVRDVLSRKVMEERGVRIDGICPDLAFHAFGTEVKETNPDAVTFSFRAEQYAGQIDDIKRFIAMYFQACGTGQPVYFVTQVKKDEPVNRELADWVGKTYGIPVNVDDGSHDILATEQLYKRSNVVVSNRLHSLLLAGSVGNAMVAAPIGSHNKKIRALFEDIGLKDHVYESASQEGVLLQQLKQTSRNVFDGKDQRAQIISCVSQQFEGAE